MPAGGRIRFRVMTLRIRQSSLIPVCGSPARGPKRSGHRTKHLNNIAQPRSELVAAVERANAGGGAGEDCVARFQGEGLADFRSSGVRSSGVRSCHVRQQY